MTDTLPNVALQSFDSSALVNPNGSQVKIEDCPGLRNQIYDDNLEDTPDYVKLEDQQFKASTQNAIETENHNFDLESGETPGEGIELLNQAQTTLAHEFFQNSLYMSGEFGGEYSGQSSDNNQGESSQRYEEDFIPDDEEEEESSMSSSDEEDAKCQICERIFLGQDDLNLHYRSRRLDDKRYMCCNCQKIFRDNTQLKVHARKHTGEKPFECVVCRKRFTVNGNLNKHMRIHTGEKRFECSDCGRKFTQFAHLEDHIKTHSGDRPFVCDYCQSAFKTKARLNKHRKSHTDGSKTKRCVKCPQCDVVLKSNRQLAGHLVTHIPVGYGPFFCIICNKEYAVYTDLLDHQRTHVGQRSYECQFCDKSFNNAGHLRRHMNSHSGFRPYSCTVCSRPFPSSQNLKRHMMTHTGEKPYICQQCKRGFLTLENLNRHIRTHTGEKPFSCKVCGKTFAHSTTAKEHLRAVHTDEKPYGCSLCNKTFAISKMLYRHIREKHPTYFPQFKEEHNLTPNQKKAKQKQELLKKANVSVPKVKKELEDSEDAKDDKNKLSDLIVNIKSEPIEELGQNHNSIKTEIEHNNSGDQNIESKRSRVQRDSRTFSNAVKMEKIDHSYDNTRKTDNENVEIPFIKVEKQDIDDT